jgi:hypothetical protein
MRGLWIFILAVSFVSGVVALMFFHVPWSVLATFGLGALCLVWLVALITLPWNIYFHAKAVLFEIKRSQERGIPVRPEREAEAKRVEKRMLRFSVGAHLFSGVASVVISYLLGSTLGYYFAGFYVLSTFVRPGVEYYKYLRARLSHIETEVHYPREDVVKLVADIKAVLLDQRALENEFKRLEEKLDKTSKQSDARQVELDRKISAISRKFEETVDRLTDNQQIISGIKAFLRLIQQGEAPPSNG